METASGELKRPADHFEVAYKDFVFQFSDLAENIAGHTPNKDMLIVKTIERLGEAVTTQPSQGKIQDKLDDYANDNF